MVKSQKILLFTIEYGSVPMKSKLRELLGVLSIIWILFSIYIPTIVMGPATLGPPPPNGDWTVSDNTVINDTLVVVNGNLTITTSGKLELQNVTMFMNGNISVEGDLLLKNVTLTMNCTTDGIYGITVNETGMMQILDYDGDPSTDDGSLITSITKDGKHGYSFWVKSGSKFKIENSVIQECGYGTIPEGGFYKNHHGLFIETGNVQIKNTTVERSRNGIIFNTSGSTDNIISNCTFTNGTNAPIQDYGFNGLCFTNSLNNFISNCKFYNLKLGLDLTYSDHNAVTNCYFEDSVSQLSINRQTLGIMIGEAENNTLINNTEKMVYYGIMLYKCKNNQIENHTIESTRYGIAVISYCEYITLENIEITDIYISGSSEAAMGVMFWEKNSHFKIINCSLSGSEAYGIAWYEDQTGSKDYLIKNCTIDVTAVALSADHYGNPTSGTIADVSIKDSYLKAEGNGFVSLYELDNWTFANCSFEKTTAWKYQDFSKSAVCLTNDANNVSFINSDFYYTGTGIDVNGVSINSRLSDITFDIQFKECNFYNNSFEGISIWQEAFSKPSPPTQDLRGNLLIENCSMRNNGRNGLLLRGDGVFVDVINCNISNNSEYGIWTVRNGFYENSEITIRECNITKNGNKGLDFNDISDSKIVIQNCSILENKDDGLYFDDVIDSEIHIKDSLINNNKNGLGIGSDNSDFNIYNCTFQKNQENGIDVSFSDSFINISKSDFFENEFGLYVAYSPAEAYKCNFLKNNYTGIYGNEAILNISDSIIGFNTNGVTLDSPIANIKNNFIHNNTDRGITVWKGSPDRIEPVNIFIENNHIENNGIGFGDHQISLSGITFGSIIENTITSSLKRSIDRSIRLFECELVNLENNIIKGNFNQYMLDVLNTNIIVNRNTILNYNQSNSFKNIMIFGNPPIEWNVQITENEFISSGFGTGFFIQADLSENSHIFGNTFSNWNIGMDIFYSYFENKKYPIYIQDNIFLDNRVGLVVERESWIENNTFKRNEVGIKIYPYSGGIYTYKNKINDNKFGFSFINISISFNITLIDDLIQNNDVVIKAENSEIFLNNYHFENNNHTLNLFNSTCNIYNSTLRSYKNDILLDESSICNIINSIIDNGSLEIIDLKSTLKRQWFLNISILNKTLKPISDVLVSIKDQYGNEILNRSTNDSGKFRWINLSSLEWNINGLIDPNPYQVILSKPGYGTTTNTLEFKGNSNATFRVYKLSEIITSLEAFDTPDDQGGSITLNWESIPILNFGRINIYYDTEKIDNIRSAIYVTSIQNQSIKSIVISQIKGIPLENGKKYYFAISVEDDDGLYDDNIINCSNPVIPIDNILPKPIKILSAHDTPNDNGGSVTIIWEISNSTDFNRYEIYCLSKSDNISGEFELNNITPNLIVYKINDTEKIISDLMNNNLYDLVVLVYDVNGNVNLSYSLYGPVSPTDNLPPIINYNISYPLYTDLLEFNTDSKKNFRIYLDTKDTVTIYWYLDEEIYKSGTDFNLTLEMSRLSFGNHSLTVVAEELNGLNDTLTWTFTVLKPIAGSTDETADFMIVIWLIIIFILIIIGIISIFSFRRFQRYQEINRTLKTIPEMDSITISELITKKREQDDKYVLEKLIEGIPSILRTKPDKLFFILSSLAADDNIKIRNSAVQNISTLLDKNPNKLFSWVRLLQEKGVKPEVFSLISNSVKNEIIKNLLDKYYYNLIAKNEEEYKTTLENSIVAFKGTEKLMNGLEMSSLYSTLNTFYNYRTVQSLSTSKSIIDKIINLGSSRKNLVYPEVIALFEKFGIIAEAIGKYEKVESIEDKISYLFQATTFIENASKLSQETLLPPEREFFNLVLNSWRSVISLSIRELRGRAKLSFNLVGKEILKTQESIILKLEINNIGRSIAERVLVEIIPSNDYSIISAPQELGNIGQNKSKELNIELKPRITEAFRVEFTIRYDDAERKGKSVSFGDLITFIEIGEEFKEIPNPYIIGLPIEAGSKLFIGRRDLIDFIRKNIKSSIQENIIVLVGHRRTGKTTLLKQLPVFLDKEFIPVYFDIQGIIDPGMDAFFHLLASEIVEAMQERGFEIEEPDFKLFRERPSYYFERVFLRDLNSKLGDSILILLCDEFEELEDKVDSGLLDKNIFSYLRHLMQHTKKIGFIFTGSSRLEQLKTDYWSILFNIALYKRVGFLSEEETKQLIIEPVKKYNMIYDSLAIDKIYRLTYGHPYFTQLLCHELVDLHNREEKNYITIQDVNGEINRIIERGQMHFDFIWDSATNIERLVMTTLIKVLNEEDRAMVSSIANKLGEYGLNIDSDIISKTLDGLANKDIISKIMNHTTTFEFKVDLIRIWMERTKHFDQVVEQYKGSS
jgi:parallel beta-helix repeat protein